MPDPVHEYLENLDTTYARLHTAKEDAFWFAKMGLGSDSAKALAELESRDVELMRLLRDPARLPRVRELLPAAQTEEDRVRLRGWIATFEAHSIESAEGRAAAEELTAADGRLEHARGEMELGYRTPSGEFIRASSVKLSSMLRSQPDEGLRRAAWEGLRSIERFVLDNGFLDIVRQRNRLGRSLGAEDFYDWKTRRVEGMSKVELFGLLDELEERTRDAGLRAVREARRKHGSERFTPWNVAYLVGGDVTHELDPYFPFGSAVERWGRSFAGLGIRYQGSELVLDLLDRRGKFENGFMHGPVVGWRHGAERIPARIQFTANAIVGMVGSGQTAMRTLFHEGGHAAHFANIDMPSPCFGQEFAPTSAAFAETQSMFCDSLLEDADWRSRYARSRDGAGVPGALLERDTDAHQPFAAWRIRTMLAVCYGEKAIYELSDAELTPERVLATLRDVERRLLFLDEGSPRPILAVPHLLSTDFSAYYHSYVLAQIAVSQARAYFLRRDGHLVDNRRIGPELARVWWQPGNSVRFSEFVERLTGKPLGAADLAEQVNRTAEECKRDASEAIARLGEIPALDGPVNLDAAIRVMHGNDQVAELGGDFESFARDFSKWIDAETARVASRA